MRLLERSAAAVVGCCCVVLIAHAAAQNRTPLMVMRLYSGPGGQSQAEMTEVRWLPSAMRKGLEESEARKVSSARFVRWPPCFEWEWHTAQTPQYVIVLAGRGEVELAGGRTFPLKPGQVVLAEDVSGKGHITRVLGSDDMVLLLVPLTPAGSLGK